MALPLHLGCFLNQGKVPNRLSFWPLRCRCSFV